MCGRTYLAEIYEPRREAEEARAETRRIVAAADALEARGVAVRHLRGIFVPSEETRFHLFAAERPEVVEQVLRDAGVEAERVSLATDLS